MCEGCPEKNSALNTSTFHIAHAGCFLDSPGIHTHIYIKGIYYEWMNFVEQNGWKILKSIVRSFYLIKELTYCQTFERVVNVVKCSPVKFIWRLFIGWFDL